MRYNLSKRLFVITLSLLLLLMGCTLIFQLVFFQNFYEDRKEKNLIKEVERFSNLYSYQLNDSTETKKALFNFENRTNSNVAIFSYDGNNAIINANIIGFGKDDSLALYFNELINNEDLINKVHNDNATASTIFYNRTTQSKKIGVVTPISLNSSNDAIFVVVSSIQPIEEATGVISEFYLYIFIGFIFISILLSSIYSNLISKPLIKINNVAQKLSNLDFSEKCHINRSDEIGNLANTLNFLSENLEDSLNDLKEKNKQLEIDIEKERSLEIMRKDFIASVSHELKTPIGIIEGYAEGIIDGIVTSKDAKAYLETIIDESKKMGVLVNNMLELSKLESGIIQPKLERFNINRLIKKVVNTLSISADEKNLNLIYKENTEYSYVLADVFKIEQVLTNLITNAIKYTPSGNNIIVSISLIYDKYKISIINEGTTIDANEINKLFDKFYKIDKSGERKSNSTGLGLAIVKNILEIHNFEYSLHNLDNSVEFVFFIPKNEMVELD